MINTSKKPDSDMVSRGDNILKAIRADVSQAQASIIGFAPLEQIKNIPQIAPLHSTTSLLQFLSSQKVVDMSYFKGKSVLDIGGGFSGVAANLYQSAEVITVVDPVFQETNLDQLLDENIKRQQEIIWLREQHAKNDMTDQKVQSDICEAQLVLRELQWWQSYSSYIYPNVARNSSYAEDLVGIPDNSQDVIFVNYVLSKDTVQIKKVIDELERVVSPEGVIIISDYPDIKNIVRVCTQRFLLIDHYQDTDGFLLVGHKKQAW